MSKIKVLIIDNYDSFTFNLYQNVGEILLEKNQEYVLDVIKNDQLSLEEIQNRNYDRIIISPGAGDPVDQKYFGVSGRVITELGKNIPIFGVCLGMQGICHFFGGKVIRAKLPMHGKTSKIFHNQKDLFQGIPQGIEVMRYHSLIADPQSLPESLEITSLVTRSDKNLEFNGSFDELLKKLLRDNLDFEIMGLKHKKYLISGIQFHPESYATEAGLKMLENFIK